MSWWSRFRNTLHSRPLDEEIAEELEFHLHMDRTGGRSGREARLRLGNVARASERRHAA